MDDRQKATGHCSALRTTAHNLSGALKEAEVIDIVLGQVVAALHAQGALMRLLNPEETELLPAGSRGLSETYLDKGPVKVSQSQIDQQVLDGEVVTIQDVTCAPGFQYPEAARAEGLCGMVAVPLTVRVRTIGVLRVYVEDVTRLGHDDIMLLSTLGDLGALSLEKVRLHQSLYRIAEALNSSLDLAPMLGQVLESAVREMGLKAASIRLIGPRSKTLHLVAAHGLSQDYLDKGSIEINKSPVDKQVLAGETVVLFDVSQEPGFEYPEEAAREGIRSVLVVPLRIKDRVLGVMRAYSATPRHFGPVGISFLSSIADLVALAVENANLYAALEARYEDLKLDVADWFRFLALG